jgi:hypothetical protein
MPDGSPRPEARARIDELSQKYNGAPYSDWIQNVREILVIEADHQVVCASTHPSSFTHNQARRATERSDHGSLPLDQASGLP